MDCEPLALSLLSGFETKGCLFGPRYINTNVTPNDTIPATDPGPLARRDSPTMNFSDFRCQELEGWVPGALKSRRLASAAMQ